MRAAVLEQLPATTLRLVDLPAPEPEADWVIVEVRACGICGTDLHIMAAMSYLPTLPFVLGHEPAGRVIAVGQGVDPQVLGQYVVPSLFVGCGECAYCKAGDERLCPAGPRVTGVMELPGGFAERVALHKRQVVPVPAGLDPVQAATIVDAGATAANAARSLLTGRVPPGPYLVVGAGPVGILVAEILRSAGYQPTLVESNEARAVEAQRLGYSPLGSVSEVGWSCAAVIDCAADPAAVEHELRLLKPQGWYLAVGYSVVPQLDLAVVARRELVLRGVRSGSPADLADVFAQVTRGAVRLPKPSVWPLREINSAFTALRDQNVPGKAVIAVQGDGHRWTGAD